VRRALIYEINIDPTFNSFIQENTLEGTTYRLTFRWNARDGYWYLHVADLNDNYIAVSRKLVPGAALLRHVVDYTSRPPGELLVVGTPTRYNLGTNEAALIYMDESELA